MAKQKDKPQAQTMEPRIIRKLRPKDIMEKPIRPHEEDWEPRILFFIYGKANDIRFTDQGAYGDSYALRGQFEAERADDKQLFYGTECFLPEPMHTNIVDRFKTAQEKDEEMPLVEFAFKIGIKQTQTVVGYEYTTVPIVQPAKTEHLQDLRAKMLERMGGDESATVSDVADAQDSKQAGGKSG